MDGLDLHPYPIPQSLPFATGYQNPRSFSVANLPRVYAAFYTAFVGTGQPTVGLLGRLPVQLNEVGIQTSSKGGAGYTGIETAAGVLGGLGRRTTPSATRRSGTRKLVDFAECDADIQSVNLFKLVDETSRAGLAERPRTTPASCRRPRRGPSADELDRVGGKCPKGRPQYWAPFDAYGADALRRRAAERPAAVPGSARRFRRVRI